MLQGFLLVMSTIIAIFAFVGGLGFIFNLLLDPVKEKQVSFESELKELQIGQARLEKGQTRLEKGQARLEDKLDFLLKEKA